MGRARVAVENRNYSHGMSKAQRAAAQRQYVPCCPLTAADIPASVRANKTAAKVWLRSLAALAMDGFPVGVDGADLLEDYTFLMVELADVRKVALSATGTELLGWHRLLDSKRHLLAARENSLFMNPRSRVGWLPYRPHEEIKKTEEDKQWDKFFNL